MTNDASVKEEPKVIAFVKIEFIEGEEKPRMKYEGLNPLMIPTLLKRVAKDVETELLQ